MKNNAKTVVLLACTLMCIGQMAAVDEGRFNYMPTDYSIIAPPPEVAALIEHNEIAVVHDSTRSISSVTYCDWTRRLPASVDMGDNKVMLRYRTDGQPAERRDTRYYMELYTDRNGVTKERRRQTMTSHRYYGNFEESGGRWRYNLYGGHITLSDGVVHYYARDYMGSTRAVYTGMRQIAPLSAESIAPVARYTVEQATDYYPTGLPVDVTGEVTGEATASASTGRLHIGNRWLDQGGLGWYDNSARYYDAILARFTTPDPLGWKRPWDSPWTHCAGNPANFFDPDGRDICVIADLYLPGHLAILIQHNDNRWYLYSKNGTNSGASSGSNSVGLNEISSSGEHLADLGELSFESPQEFLDSDYNNSRENPYTCGVAFETTEQQDKDAISAVTKEINSSYSVLTSNCAHAVQAALRAAGLTDGANGGFSTFNFISTPGILTTNRFSVEDVSPEGIMRRIRLNNEGGTQYEKN